LAILVIGGGISQQQYVEKLKEWGCFVYVTDRDQDAPCFSIADDHALVSTQDLSGTIAVIKKKGLA